MGFRFLHVADLHLETHFGGSRQTRARLRAATLEAFDRAVTYAIDQNLHAVLLAGDVYDDPLLSLRTEAVLTRQLRKLTEAGIWCLIAAGNHDPGGEMFRARDLCHDLRDTSGLARVHWFRGPRPEPVSVCDGDGQPVGIVVGAGHSASSEATNLARAFPTAHEISNELPVVGLLHTHVASAKIGAQHERYAPSASTDYHRLGYAYWALGHIHARQRAVPDLPVFYAGNLQGRNPRETGPKGGFVVDAQAGSHAEPEFVRLAPVRWLREEIELPRDLSSGRLADHLSATLENLREWPGEEIAARLELVGEHPLAVRLRDAGQREDLAREIATRTGALEIQLRTEGLCQPVNRDELRRAATVLAHALALLDRLEGDPELLAQLAPSVLAGAPDPGTTPDSDYLRELLVGLPEELISRYLEPSPATSEKPKPSGPA
ncbi:exonuclease SbcCD subunit D [Myxococcota bacterium]|nr:exonuclease SbcCD subunit D [Myxococcota bacterium]